MLQVRSQYPRSGDLVKSTVCKSHYIAVKLCFVGDWEKVEYFNLTRLKTKKWSEEERLRQNSVYKLIQNTSFLILCYCYDNRSIIRMLDEAW